VFKKPYFINICVSTEKHLLMVFLHLPPKGELENKVVLKMCVEARAALASLKQATALIPNPTVLINTIPLLERCRKDHGKRLLNTAAATAQ
jgi:hypothetical protein